MELSATTRRQLLRDALDRVFLAGCHAVLLGGFWWQTRLLGLAPVNHLAWPHPDPTLGVIAVAWALELARLTYGSIHNEQRVRRGDDLLSPY